MLCKQLNCVEYKYNRKRTETNRRWVYKASFLPKNFWCFYKKVSIKYKIYFIQCKFDAVSKNFCTPYRKYL